MSSDDDERQDRAPRRMIHDMRRRVQMVRNQYWDEGVEGQVSVQTHKELAAACIQYYDVLYEFRDESVLDDGDFPNIAPLRQRLGQRVERHQPSAGRGRGVSTQTVPAITEIPVEEILQLTEDLDDLAKKLGFGAQARETTPHDDIGHEDLAALLEARGQDDALEKVPGGS
ncbi:uncharacterized protein NP_7010A (plasmid) [Natronomonas pharaonis DSM 2160]|uniref:Uncharacterized protein n=1 Tax=Natronomonas pharaonis (strain ATCC 35678 / DSM 2160 / CIP 103997 / JCM 8858 / NBRC 14720 / NCIMB 2260 / Gabara) TaxID=348780 RepID=Q3ILU9_NATPD|nr:hypothetical protein [Natronomonas pharaonis]CAI49734.1 uncharacterized protein NP_3286A [Natronomonas pharaonis DSM 2160]CAI50921.1 uncharacterized protein NP_7010A [Natronomonas pharaonis DSM 2160]